MRTSLLALALLSVAAAGPAAQTPALTQDAAWQLVQQHVAAYVHLRDDVLCLVPPIRSASMAEVLAGMDARRRMVRAARPRAKAGDVMPVEVYPFLRDRIAATVREHRIDVPAFLAERAADIPPGAPPAVINGPFPWQFGAITPPCLMEALPRLPAAIQYRFVGRDLYLIDADIDLIIDIMPMALPDR